MMAYIEVALSAGFRTCSNSDTWGIFLEREPKNLAAKVIRSTHWDVPC